MWPSDSRAGKSRSSPTPCIVGTGLTTYWTYFDSDGYGSGSPEMSSSDPNQLSLFSSSKYLKNKRTKVGTF